MNIQQKKSPLYCKWTNFVVLISLFLYIFIIPGITSIFYLNDQGLYTGKIPIIALRTHRLLTNRYGQWLRSRIDSKRATQVNTSNISGTEWPLFGTVFYLWATEAIEEELSENISNTSLLPSRYAKDTIKLAAKFCADSDQAVWVKNYWGEDYLHKENLFYRMLLMSGLLSYEKILGDKTYESILRDQVTTLAQELDSSAYGLLDDYPGQCYPIDIIAAIAVINRADKLLGTDHSIFVKKALRGFQGSRLDPGTLLPAYNADSKTGYGLSSARGIGMSFMLIWAPELWKETAIDWYSKYKKLYWQERCGIVGFREFSKAQKNADWWADADSGPVIGGFGVAATAFGIGAARANNHFDDAYALSSEAIVLSWPLLDGTLLGAQLLSNFSDAPYLGETALVFLLTRQPQMNNTDSSAKKIPVFVYIVIFLYFFIGFLCILRETIALKKWLKRYKNTHFFNPIVQFAIWLILISAGIYIFFFGVKIFGILLILVCQMFPIGKIDVKKGEKIH